MKYFELPLLILLLAASYLCVIYLGLGWIKRLGMTPRKDDPLDATETVRPS